MQMISWKTKVRYRAACLLSVALLAGGAALGQEYWVSPAGSDTEAGTKEKPFATPQRVRDALREARKGGLPQAGATVWLRGGVYRMDKTLELNAQDSGTAGAPVVYRSAPGEEVRLAGGTPIPAGAFKPPTDPNVLQRLDPSARGNILQADLKAVGITDYGKLTRRGGIERSTLPAALELFFNDRPMPLARWPNQGWTRIAAVPEGPKGERFRYDGDRPKRWRTAEDIWVHGYMNRNWCDTYEQVAVLDSQRREIVTREPHDYRGYKAGQRFRFLNVLEELDEPGEWYVDRMAGTLYFWPPEPIGQSRVCVSLLETPLVALRRTEYVRLEGLVLECTRGCGVEIIGGSHNRVAGCTLRNSGTVGVTIGVVEPDLERRIYTDTTFKGDAGTDNGVVSCEIHDTGEYGIILAGGDRKTLAAGRNFAVNNDIHHFGRWVRTYRPAIFLFGVGNRVAHNRLHDAPHTAVLFWGNDHLLEFNDVYRVCTDTGDAGAFYIGRDWSQRGNIIRYNHFHDLAATLAEEQGFNAVMGVYLDDQASGMSVFGNVFSRVNCGVMVGGGRDNTIANNIFAFCGRAISLDARGMGDNYSTGNTLFDRLKPIHHDRPPYSERYPALAPILSDEPGQPKGNEVSRNICVGGPWDIFSLSRENEFVRKLVKLESNLTEGDPGLVAPQKGDFRLKEDSPALRLGFQPIPLDKIGPLPDGDLPDVPEGRKLNNLVTLLLDVAAAPTTESFPFVRLRDGWVFISFTTHGEGALRLTLDKASPGETPIHPAPGSGPAYEAMHHVTKGRHRLQVERTGTISLEHLTVKAIPELMHCGLGFNPQIKSYGFYDMDFLRRDILPNVTTLIVPNNIKLSDSVIEDWHRQGKRFIAEVGINSQARTADEHAAFWTGFLGKAPFLDGTIINEFIVNRPVAEWVPVMTPDRRARMDQERAAYESYAEAFRKTRADSRYAGKSIYAYVGGSGKKLNQEIIGTHVIRTMIDCGYFVAPERYLHEMSSEQGSRDALQAFLDGLADWEAKEPGVKKQMVITFGLFSMPPGGINKQPNVDYHVWMDQQMNLVANDPTLVGLAGLNWWTSLLADEETVRFVGKLYRHYALEGRTDRLTRDPLFLRHIQNADFEHGTDGWVLHPAEAGSIAAKSFPRYGRIEGRYMGLGRPADPEHIGDTFLWMKRSEKGPNTFSQTIRDLQPGRLYSFKMFVCDYRDLVTPTPRKIEETRSISSVRIEGAEVDAARSFTEVYTSSPEPKVPVCITYHWKIFRAKTTTATLTVSDWPDPNQPTAPFGQEQAFNFLEIQPYYE